VCDAETIDTVVKQGLGARMAVLGPMEQSDPVGLDLTLDIANVLYPDLDRTAGPHPFLQAKVDNGHLGMKTGEGFRKWSALEADTVRAELSRFLARKAKQEISRAKEAAAAREN
jgi:3-hydroxybutyryl-CoA dehydrogenase